MSVFESLAPSPPTIEQGALRIKRTLARTFQQMEVALEQVRLITERHGAEQLREALGADRAEVAELYGSLKALVEKHKPGAIVPSISRQL